MGSDCFSSGSLHRFYFFNHIHVWVLWPSRSCDQDAANKLSFPYQWMQPGCFAQNLALIGQALGRCLTLWTDARQMPEHGHTISCPGEPSAQVSSQSMQNYPACNKLKVSRIMRKPTFWFLTRSNINKAVQSQKMARGLKFLI